MAPPDIDLHGTPVTLLSSGDDGLLEVASFAVPAGELSPHSPLIGETIRIVVHIASDTEWGVADVPPVKLRIFAVPPDRLPSIPPSVDKPDMCETRTVMLCPAKDRHPENPQAKPIMARDWALLTIEFCLLPRRLRFWAKTGSTQEISSPPGPWCKGCTSLNQARSSCPDIAVARIGELGNPEGACDPAACLGCRSRVTRSCGTVTRSRFARRANSITRVTRMRCSRLFKRCRGHLNVLCEHITPEFEPEKAMIATGPVLHGPVHAVLANGLVINQRANVKVILGVAPVANHHRR